MLLFVPFTLNTFAQEIQLLDSTKWLCQYNYNLMEDSTNRNSVKNNAMVLQIGSHLSKFSPWNTLIGDSLRYYNQGIGLENFAQLLSKAMYRAIPGSLLAAYGIYKNYPAIGSIFFTAYGNHLFYKLEQPMKMIWELDNQQDSVILGFNCQKAYTTYGGRDYIAWYSPQIPISEGPYKFNGLPGLILKISDTKNQHSFTVNAIKKVTYNQAILKQTRKFVDITAADYIKAKRNDLMRLYGSLQNGTITSNSEEAKAQAMHGIISRNNFIEKS